MAKRQTVRMHLDLNAQCRDTLERLRDTTDTTLSEVVRRALALYDFVIREKESGSKVILRNADGDREVILL